MNRGRIFIGTSGWSYDHWREVFYPAGLAASRRLEYYREHFTSAEINNTFYRLPEIDTLRAWRETVGAEFVFSVKASRYITHMKKLKTDDDSLSRFMECIAHLGETLGVILFQLPPHWHVNLERLEQFLGALDHRHRYAFEFRDPSWVNDDVFDVLRAHNAAFCIYELGDYRAPREVTADFVYIRLHGPDSAYRGRYARKALAGWAGAVTSWCREGLDVYLYFDNDEAGYAVENARELAAMLGKT